MQYSDTQFYGTRYFKIYNSRKVPYNTGLSFMKQGQVAFVVETKLWYLENHD